MEAMTSPGLSSFARALLVEDEESLASSLAIALKKLQIPVVVVENLAQSRMALTESDFDLILLDRTLPDGDGIELCVELRQNEYRGAILMLTARGQMPERVEGLQSGADDYLPKPFSWEELEARIKALFRSRENAVLKHKADRVRARQSGPSLGWERDAARLRIKGPRGVWVELTPLEFKLADHLMEARGEILSRDALLKEVWGFTLLPRTRTVDHFLGRLRRHFETNPEDPVHFLTVRGAGYRFEP